ncbi:MAG: UDP-N-acetylglucosamine 1-carboxyvinyltransferase [Acetilactobacillus jinshanensis]
MNEMIIHGGNRLSGEVTIGGAKNSTVALIPAAILADTPVKLLMVPDILDVHNLMMILESMNVPSKFVHRNITIDPTHIKDNKLSGKAIASLRASYYFMGALLGRFGHATVNLPGGDSFGPRPIDQHIKAFRRLGATVTENNGCIHLTTHGKGLHGARIHLAMVSVGATINSLLAAVKAHGTTVIENAAKEPEIIDVVNFLNEMGAHITGEGTHTIMVHGVKSLKAPHPHRIIPDRIEAGTYLSMAAAVGNGIKINNVIPAHLKAFMNKLREMGVKIKTQPFPGFATDLQQPITPLLLKADGESVIRDTIYPHRTKHVPQLAKMGAHIHVNQDGLIVIKHTDHLTGAHIKADEIRAGAADVIAGLMAHGTTVISKAGNILRGYDNIIGKLTNLNANVELVRE